MPNHRPPPQPRPHEAQQRQRLPQEPANRIRECSTRRAVRVVPVRDEGEEMSILWRRLQRNVITGKETPKVDLKREISLKAKPQKAEFAKDVMAIANTPGGLGYIVYGVLDTSERSTEDPSDYIVGIDPSENADKVSIQMVDALDYWCDVPPRIKYETIIEPGTQKTLGIVVIERSPKKPHGFSRDHEDVFKNNIPIRRGSRTYLNASAAEIKEMMAESSGKKTSVVLVSFSGHPITDKQSEQISAAYFIDETIEIGVHFDDSPLLEQARTIVQKAGLTLDEWSSGKVLLVPPGLTPPAITLLAYIHGLTGNFPKVVWIERRGEEYVLRETINLQDIRDMARGDRLTFNPS